MSGADFWAPTARDVARVTGPDARSYLQSQLSQDLAPVAAGSSVWSFLLQPTGKVTALVRVTVASDEELLVDVDAGSGAEVMARLERFRIRVKADIGALDWRAIAVRGPSGSSVVPPAEGVVAPAWWGPESGYDLLGPEVVPPPNVGEGDADRLEAARIEAGWPAMGAEVTDQTIPGELGPVVFRSVSFTKGCYPGQELVERMESRGAAAPRQLRRVRATGGEALVVGATVTADGRDVGRVTSAAGSVALALVGRAVDPGSPVAVDGVTATVEAIA
jgi:folate-binding protein YgfZ